MKLKKGDDVLVIAGNDKGRRGAILQVVRESNRVIVDGINVRWKTRKPNQQQPKGERFQEACSIHASNVMLVDPATGKGTRKRPADGKAAKKS
jgi:large subunit ribosomal protein L24